MPVLTGLRAVSLAMLVSAVMACAFSPALQALPMSVRSIDGFGNNDNKSDWGKAGTPLLRTADPEYPLDVDGQGSGENIIAPPDRPNPRDISNKIAAQGLERIFNDRWLSDMAWQWGQFIDHDMALTPMGSEYGTAHIPVGDKDPLGPDPIPFFRSEFKSGTGTSTENPRQQINAVTAFLDGSHIYGSDIDTAADLRTLSGGKLKTSAGNMLPKENGDYLAGDERVNEQIALTAMHTLFVREHNRLAEALADEDPLLTDEEIYQYARKIVGAEIQSITYNEFLPALLGPDAPSPLDYSYDESINPGIANAFATAFYRLGHSMLSSNLLLVNEENIPFDSVPLRDAFFNPAFYWNEDDYGNSRLDQIFKGLASKRAQEIDNKLVDDVRNFLFGSPGAGGMDLASLNIQRGRDHGLPDYNSLREAYGLDKVSSFEEITADTKIQVLLAMLYKGDINNIDAWIGALAEDHRRGSSLGETMTAAMLDQFTRLRDGDSQFYTGDEDLLDPLVQMVIDLDNLTLADVIRANTYITDLGEDVFFAPIPSPSSAALVLIGLAGLLLGRRRL